MGISIIIPTYDNVEYIDETINSILVSGKNYDIEILIGIDGCWDTLNYIINKKYNKNVKFFFFNENRGPYLIKNTLANISNYDKLLFFDSDDIMLEDMISRSISSLEKYAFIKPRLSNFTVINGVKFENKGRREWGEGVFAIRKDVFLKYNGFEPWPVAADSDFMGRLYKNNIPFEMSENVLMLRRIHDKGLTSRPDTGLRSTLRQKYAYISKTKSYHGPLEKLSISEYTELKNINIDEMLNLGPITKLSDIITEDNIEVLNLIARKNEVIDKIRDRKSIPPQTKNEKKPMIIDYEKVNKILKNRVIPKKEPKVENNPIEVKHNPSNKEIANLMFPGKKNRRNGDPLMTFGKK